MRSRSDLRQDVPKNMCKIHACLPTSGGNLKTRSAWQGYNGTMRESEAELSEREQEILRLVATGASNKDIGRILGISANTVKVHLRNIFTKTGIESRTASVFYAIQHGLMEPAASVEAPAFEKVAPPVKIEKTRLRRGLWLLAAGLVLAGVLLLGGRFLGLRSETSSLTTLPTAQDVRRWSSQPFLPQGRGRMAAAAFNGDLYLIGGHTSGGVTASTLRFLSAEKRWEERAPKPLAVQSAGAVLLGERIYIPGGETKEGRLTAALEIYDPRGDHWERGADMPEPLSSYALAAFEGRLYVFGGHSAHGISDRVYSYDPIKDEWRQASSLPFARQMAVAAPLEGSILVVGGFDGRQALVETLAYYPGRESGSEPAWEILASLPGGRYEMSAAVLAGTVYLAGGNRTENAAPWFLCYSPHQSKWFVLENPSFEAGVGLAVVAVDTRLHILGGMVGGELQARHQTYQAIYNLLIPLIP